MLWFIGISLNQSQSPDKTTVPLQNSLEKELVLVERAHSKVVLVMQEKTLIGQIVKLAVSIYSAEI